MPRRGDNIYKRKDKRWEGRYIKGYDETGKVRYGYVYAKTYKETKEKLSDARMNVSNTVIDNNRKKDFGFYCDEWLILSRNRIKESSYVKYHNSIACHIKPNLGSYLPQKLNTVIIENFSNDLLCQGLSPKTVRDTLTFEVVKNTSPTTEHKKLIGNAESYFLKINGKAEFAVSLLIPLDVKYARSTATLYEKPALQNWSSVQSALIDESGYVELYLSDFDSVTEYLIAIDVYNTDSSTVIIPESLYDEYGGLTDSEGNKYVISGTNTLFNMSFWQFGLVVLGVIVGTGVLVGVVMMIINKRKKTLEEIRKEVSREEQ